MQTADGDQHSLDHLPIQPGQSQFFQQVTMGKQGFGQFNLYEISKCLLQIVHEE